MTLNQLAGGSSPPWPTRNRKGFNHPVETFLFFIKIRFPAERDFQHEQPMPRVEGVGPSPTLKIPLPNRKTF